MTDPRTAYRENDVGGATSVRLVVLLYDQLIQDLIRAAHAIEQNDIELRTKMLNHAILVIAHLQSPLDFAKGGKVAQDLNYFVQSLQTGDQSADHGRTSVTRSVDRGGPR